MRCWRVRSEGGVAAFSVALMLMLMLMLLLILLLILLFAEEEERSRGSSMEECSGAQHRRVSVFR